MYRAAIFNDTDFAYETFATGVVVLDLIEGTYFELGGSAPVFWEDLVKGRSSAEIAVAIREAVATAEIDIEASLNTFLDECIREGILVSVDEPETNGHGKASYVSIDRFEPPVLEKHVDMQDLLTLDPIHDVDPERGWPHT